MMDKEITLEYITKTEELDPDHQFKFLIFASLESKTLKEIGWERFVSAQQIKDIIYEYMNTRNLVLIAKDGELFFTHLPL